VTADIDARLEQLGKASSRSALMGALGLTVLLGSLAISAVQIHKSEQTLAQRAAQLEAKQQESLALDRRLSERSAEIRRLDEQKAALLKDVAQAQEQAQAKEDALSSVRVLASEKNQKAILAVVDVGNAAQLWQQGFKAFNEGKRAEAQKFYEQSIAADPTYAPAYNSLGRLKDAAGDLKGAEELYQKAVNLRGDYAPALYNLALIAVRRGDLPQGKIWNDKALAARPNYAPARALASSQLAH